MTTHSTEQSTEQSTAHSNAHSTGPDTHRQLLVHCTVTNPHGSCSERFVDQQTWTLWREMLATRHSLASTYIDTCVWLPSPEFDHHQALFGHGASHAVNRLAFETWDPVTRICNRRVRFVRAAGEMRVLELLQNHFAVTAPGQQLTLHRVEGHAVPGTAARHAA